MLSNFEVYQWDQKLTKNETQKQLQLEQNTSYHDTTPALSNNVPHSSRDVQDIPWGQMAKLRCQYRKDRLDLYEQFHTGQARSIDETKPLGDLVDLKPLIMPHMSCDVQNYYHFAFNARMSHAGLTHFQLRHLIRAMNYKNKVLYINHRSCLFSFDPISRTSQMELDLRNREEPPVISTIAAYDDLAIMGSFRGEIILKCLSNNQIYYSQKITTAQNAITNHIQLTKGDSGGAQAIIANNDAAVRFLNIDASECTVSKLFQFDFCVNHASIPNDRTGKNAKLLAVLGDDHCVHILDHSTMPCNSKPILSMSGHLDFCFAASWHPTNDNILVTGSQDRTARIWDIRMPKQSVQLLCGCVGPVRNIVFSRDGKYLAFSEPADFVHLFRADQFPVVGEQMLDLFGEICGIDFSNVDVLNRDSLHVGIFDRNYNSIVQFDRSISRSIDMALV